MSEEIQRKKKTVVLTLMLVAAAAGGCDAQFYRALVEMSAHVI